jgi:metal-responsive CopG/Arc/MetJ family transcriptional regulator
MPNTNYSDRKSNTKQLHMKVPDKLLNKIDEDARKYCTNRSYVVKQKLAEIYFKNETNESKKDN